MKYKKTAIIILFVITYFNVVFCQTQTTVTFKPGPTTGKDVAIFELENNCIPSGWAPLIVGQTPAEMNFYNDQILEMVVWTWSAKGCGAGTIRSLLKFDELSTIPTNATILSAELKLFAGVITSYSISSGGSSSLTGSNDCYIQRITNNWNDQTVTWNTQPTTTTINQLIIPPTNSPTNYVNNSSDLLATIEYWVQNPSQNYGFMLKLITESYYRNMTFASCKNTDPTKWPELTITYQVDNIVNVSICEGETFEINGHSYSQPGSYHEGNTYYNISVFPKYNNVINATICEGQTYNQNGFSENTNGIYVKNLQTIHGCDSIVTLNLTVIEKTIPSFSGIETVFCNEALIPSLPTTSNNGISGIWSPILNNHQTTKYTFTPNSGQGQCIDNHQITITVNPKFNKVFTENICFGETYNKNGFFENSTGTYIKNLQSIHGCDSIVTLNLTVNPKYNNPIIYATICDNQFYTENGFNTNHKGLHTKNLTTIHGCDSIVTLDLTVLKTSKTIIRDTICQGDNYFLNGFNLIKVMNNDTVSRHLQGSNGCDSIITLILNVTIPNVKISTNPNDFCENLTINLIANTNQQNIVWSTKETISEITVTRFGKYSVCVNDGNACTIACDSILIRPCIKDLIVPEIITPNGDGINDTWVIGNLEYFSMYMVSVFNRWGQRLFFTQNDYKPWDGKYKGHKLPAGTYIYIIEVDFGKKQYGNLLIYY